MSATLQKILEEVKALTPLEKVELRNFLANVPERASLDEQQRLALIDELCGKYRDSLSPTEEFMARKHEENEREEQRFERR